MTRVLPGLCLIVVFALAVTSVAVAHHQHELSNPGTTVTLPCEPAHIAEQPHPLHYGLHNAVDPDIVEERGNPGPVTVQATEESCPVE